MIPLSVPVLRGNEWKYVKDCLDTGWVSSVGAYVEKFETTVMHYINAPFAVAMSNGTSALHLSLLAAGVEPEDEVIVPTLTFIAAVNAVKYAQAHPVFMDCETLSLGMDVKKLEQFLNKECTRSQDGALCNRNSLRRVKAIVPVHVFGHPVDMDPLMALAKAYGLVVIEDATESIGSEYKGKKTGILGDIGCFSFNGNKIITTGGGGMVTTRDQRAANHIRHLSTQAKCDPIEYDHDHIGYNYRLTNVQAALGVAQMELLEEFIRIKRANAQCYQQLLAGMSGVKFFTEQPWARSNCWFYTIQVPGHDKDLLMKYLLSKGIQVRPIWKLIHTLPMYKNCQAYDMTEAFGIYDSCLNIPCSVNLTQEEINQVVSGIKSYFDGAAGGKS